jgi:hypothetical protein
MNYQFVYLVLAVILILLLCNVEPQKENFKLSDDLICGVSDDDKLWCAWENIYNNPKWYQIKGGVKYVALNDKNNLYGLDEVGNLYFRNDYDTDYKNPINWNIPNIPGEELKTFSQVSTDKDVVCAIDTEGKLFCYDRSNLIDPTWAELAPPEGKEFKNTTIKDGQIFAITSENEIYYKERYNDDEWKLLSNSLTQISTDGKLVCGVDANNEVHCYDNGKILNPNWVKIEGKLLDTVIVRNGVLIGTDSNKEIFINKNYKSDKPVWAKIPGNGLKQIDISKKNNQWI